MQDKLLSLKIPGQDNAITPPPGLITTGDAGLAGIIQWVIIVLVAVGIVAALIFLIWGAIKWITSGGDKEKIAGARNTILFSIIGLIVVLLSVVIIQFVGGILGVTIFDLPESSSNTTNSRKNIEKGFDCPDGSENYACGKTDDTQCPLCSPRKDCSISRYSIAECSSGPGCKKNSDCPASTCKQGEKSASYCSSEGFCKSHCLPDDYQLKE